jgi:hypothetical protein
MLKVFIVLSFLILLTGCEKEIHEARAPQDGTVLAQR